MRMVASLDELANPGNASRPQQLAQLGERLLVAVRKRSDQKGTLTRTALRPLTIRCLGTSVAGSLHGFMVAAHRVLAMP